MQKLKRHENSKTEKKSMDKLNGRLEERKLTGGLKNYSTKKKKKMKS